MSKTLDYVFTAAGRLNRVLTYRLSGGVQQVSINGGAFTTTGASAYTPDAEMKFVIATAQGGGGAGAGAGGAGASNVSVGAPGASGAFGRGRFTVADIGASKTITVGAGGAKASNTAGTNGGASSVGSLLVSPGGTGGGLLNNQVPPAVNGNGTGLAPTAGDNLLGIAGAAGTPTFAGSASANGMFAGSGGASPFGPGPCGPAGNNAGVDAFNIGTGGTGVALNQAGGSAAGGNGAPGLVIIEEYI